MLEIDDATSRTLPILPKLIVPLRAALVSLFKNSSRLIVTCALFDRESWEGCSCLTINCHLLEKFSYLKKDENKKVWVKNVNGEGYIGL